MTYYLKAKRLDYLHELIGKGQLCSPYQLTQKFNCSERTARSMINDLRNQGHNVRYSRSRKKYYIADE